MEKILISGASKGIGKAITLKLLENGHSILGIAREFVNFPMDPKFLPIPFDLSDSKKLPQFTKELVAKHKDISTIICNAGKGLFGNLEEFSFSQIEEIMNLNFLSHVFLVKAFLPLFKKKQEGRIIIIGSEAALQGKKKGSIYCASKFALRGFTQALKEECSTSKINITLINPGMVKTEFFDNLNFMPGNNEEEHLLPDDIANLVLFLIQSRSPISFDEINLSPQKKVINFSKDKP